MLQETNSLYPPCILVIGHILLLLECGNCLLPFTLKHMGFMYIHNNSLVLKKMFQNDPVLKITQTQPNTTLLKNSTMLSEWVNKTYTNLSKEKYFPRTVIMISSSSRTTTHLYTKLSITLSQPIIPIT